MVSTHYGIEISAMKTEWIVMRHENSINNSAEKLTLKWKPLNKENQFRYLCATTANNGDCTIDITIRTAALSIISCLSSTFKNRKIASTIKISLYKSLIQPIALYVCETWTIRQTEEKKLIWSDSYAFAIRSHQTWQIKKWEHQRTAMANNNNENLV